MGFFLSALMSLCIAVILFALRRVSNFIASVIHMKQVSAKIPGPPVASLLGNLLHFAGPRRLLYDKLVRISDQYGPTIRVWVGHILFVVVTDPEDLELVLKSPKLTEKSFTYKAIEPLTGKGSLTLSGAAWRSRRRVIAPSLHLDNLHSFIPSFYQSGKLLAERMEALADTDNDIDVKPICGMAANSSVLRTILSAEVNDQGEGNNGFVTAVHQAMDHLIYRLWHPWLLSDWLFSFNRRYSEYIAAKHTVDSFVQGIISQKKSLSQSNNEQKHRRRAFLDHVLASTDVHHLNDKELADEVKTVIIAASESSMDGLCFIIYSVSIQQDIQDKIYQEVTDVLGSDVTRPIESSDVKHMEYLERVIKEVLRFFPLIPVFGRHCPEDLKLPSGFTAPRGCQIFCWLPKTHMDPHNFPDPSRFDPDRFLPDAAQKRHAYSYLPFSAGPRNCVGQRYAMMFLKTVTAELVRRVRFVPATGAPQNIEKVSPEMTFPLSISGGAKIRIEWRNPTGTI